MMQKKKITYRESHQSNEVVNNYQHIYAGFDPSFKITDRFSYARWMIEKQVIVKYLERHADEHSTQNCLDFACGTGRLTAIISHFFKRTVGIDISNKMLDIARNNYPIPYFVSGDITKKNALDGEIFDIAFAFRFFLRAEYSLRKDAFTALRRHIKDGGHLIFNVHDSKRSLNWPLFIYSKILKRESPVHSDYDLGERRQFEIDEVSEMVRSCGFVIEDVKTIGFIPNYLYGLPIIYRVCYHIDLLLYQLGLPKHMAIERIYICRAI